MIALDQLVPPNHLVTKNSFKDMHGKSMWKKQITFDINKLSKKFMPSEKKRLNVFSQMQKKMANWTWVSPVTA
ncbi:Uncharacterised protein [Niallia circulans]|uniref:Uncharacterized protein n=1 Tax=Niallia circulans TaxID=1397 RepID=A0A0J1IP93_NIACI|nr:hypothetical protein ABW02_02450 [Niallia circulans]SPU10530.1 Uncharacterised protein [Niallia circulans]